MKGSKTKRGSNSWLISIYDGIDPATGKKKYIRETFRGDAKEADKRIAEIITDRERGEYVKSSKQLFGDFLFNTWLPAKKTSVAIGTYEEYKIIVENHILKDPIAKVRMTDLELSHFDGYKIRKLNAGVAPKTVKNHIIAMKTALNYAVKGLKILKYNPAQYVENPYVPDFIPHTLNEDDGAKFLNASIDDRFDFYFLLSLFYGKRKSEILGLRKRDIDIKNLSMSIIQGVTKSGYKAIYGNPKTKETRKNLPLEPWMVPLFEYEFKKRAEEKAQYEARHAKKAEGRYKNPYVDHDLVFASYNGNPIDKKILAEHYKNILKKAGLSEDIRLHDLRHSCATILLKEGVSLKLVQERLAHADIKTTGKYSHAIPTMQNDVNRQMTKVLQIDFAKRRGFAESDTQKDTQIQKRQG